MDFKCCRLCGVAFDVGKNYCVELGCGVPKRITGIIQDVSRPAKVIRIAKPKRVVKPRKPIDPVYTRFVSCRYRATKKHLDFNLTMEFVGQVMHSPCEYCGDPGISELDRKDSGQGYLLDNVVAACRRCNTIKNNVVSYEEMLFIASHLGWKV